MKTYGLGEIQAFTRALYGDRKILMVPYGYTLTFSALAQSTTQSGQLTITANADFLLTEILYRAQIAGAQTVSTKTAAFVRLLITDSGSNEQFTNAAADIENYCSNADQNRVLPFPRFIQGRTALTVQATNYAPTAETYTTLDLYFSGVLIRSASGT